MMKLKPTSRPSVSTVLIASVLMTVALGCKGNRGAQAGVRTSQRLDFNQDVQPILASNCFRCHAPDPEMRKAGLRLDLDESAFHKRPGKPDGSVPGHPKQSDLIRRIKSKDPHNLMPQTSQRKAKPMKPEEVAILKEYTLTCKFQGLDQKLTGTTLASVLTGLLA